MSSVEPFDESVLRKGPVCLVGPSEIEQDLGRLLISPIIDGRLKNIGRYSWSLGLKRNKHYQAYSTLTTRQLKAVIKSHFISFSSTTATIFSFMSPVSMRR